jgi:maleate isomerase
MPRVGIIFTPDNAADADFWRWAPDGTTLHFTRTSLESETEGGGTTWVPSDAQLIESTRSLVTIEPAVVALACTSGSFARGLTDEQRIRTTIESAGAEIAVTTSGSLLRALASLRAMRVAVATPYDGPTTDRLSAFLSSAGYEVASLISRPPATSAGLSQITREQVRELAAAADRPWADVLFIGCAALETFDLIAELERTCGKPVLTSTQVTMWAALGAAGIDLPSVGQALFTHRWRPPSGMRM